MADDLSEDSLSSAPEAAAEQPVLPLAGTTDAEAAADSGVVPVVAPEPPAPEPAPVPEPAPEPEPAPAALAEAQPVTAPQAAPLDVFAPDPTPGPAAVSSPIPELESTTLIPASGDPSGTDASGEGGGEWELLLGKVRQWLDTGKLQALWAQARTPISLTLAAAALLMVLRVYTALLSAIESLPLIPGLLELVGVVWAVRFGVPRLLQRSQRQELFGSLQERWNSFRGRG
jgi:hypothetical protein